LLDPCQCTKTKFFYASEQSSQEATIGPCLQDFLENGEGLTDGAAREAKEEALIKPIIGPLIAVVDVIHAHQVHVFFRAHLQNLEFGPGKESLDVKLFKLSEIPWEQMAFKTGKIALRAQINKSEDDWKPVYETLP